MLPHGIEWSIGIRNIAEMIGTTPERALEVLRELEVAGLVATTNGAVVNGMMRYHYWYRP
jgi:DNA-binding Lrp family transcriptional regulator